MLGKGNNSGMSRTAARTPLRLYTVRTAGRCTETPIRPPDHPPDARGKPPGGGFIGMSGLVTAIPRSSAADGASCRVPLWPAANFTAWDRARIVTHRHAPPVAEAFPRRAEVHPLPTERKGRGRHPASHDRVPAPECGPLPDRLTRDAQAPHRFPERDEPLGRVQTEPAAEVGAHPDTDRRPGHIRTDAGQDAGIDPAIERGIRNPSSRAAARTLRSSPSSSSATDAGHPGTPWRRRSPCTNDVENGSPRADCRPWPLSILAIWPSG